MRLTKKQNVILFVGILAFVLAGLAPPWHCRHRGYQRRLTSNPNPLTWGFIFAAPRDAQAVAFGILAVEWILVGVVTGAGIFWTRDREGVVEARKTAG